MPYSMLSKDAIPDPDPAETPVRKRRPSFSSHILTAHEKEKKRMRDYKALLVRQGRCRQCTAKRGISPSKSRCLACYQQAREQQREKHGGRAYRANQRYGGRKPLDWKDKLVAERKVREKRESSRTVFGVPIDRTGPRE
jgi:hypothetical protein